MKIMLIICLLLAYSYTMAIPRIQPVVSRVPRTYKVSLDDSPQDRWRQILHDFAEPLKNFMDEVHKLPIPQSFYKGVEWYAKNVFTHQDFVAQVDAIAKLSGYPFEQIFFLNFMYQFSTLKSCTGLVFRNSAGQIIHARNLDFPMWHLIGNLMVNVEYYQGQRKVFSVDTVVGSAFALTGIRHGAFAVNVDTRGAGKHFYIDLISVMLDDAIPTVWLLRKVLAEQVSYANALKKLKTERIGGPAYYILSGVEKNQGCVIERDTNKVNAYYELTDIDWFLVQTNYDRDYPDPLYDPRRIAVQQRLRQRGNAGLQPQQIMDKTMSIWPTFNIQTIMTALMIPSTGYHNTTVWYGSDPSQKSTSK